MIASPCAQDGYRLRFEWGLDGAREIATGAAVVAVVDVLSFTTTLTVAVERGAEVFPYRWRDASAAAFARNRHAVLAVSRSQAGPGDVSLSPATVRAARPMRRLVLPSPNGSTIAHSVAAMADAVIGVSLRNVTAAAAWLAQRIGRDASTWVAVVAAGECRAGGTLRPAVEDLWGAGGFLARLAGHGIGPASPEADSAMAAYRAVGDRLPDALSGCVSGRELIEAGYRQDLDVAAEVDASAAVPVLTGDSFRHASG